VTEDDNYDADPWEVVLGDLRTGVEEEIEVGEDEDGGTGPHDQVSFFEKALREVKRFLSWLYQILKVLFSGKAPSYEGII
jgi:hypothetical protein